MKTGSVKADTVLVYNGTGLELVVALRAFPNLTARPLAVSAKSHFIAMLPERKDQRQAIENTSIVKFLEPFTILVLS